MQLSKLENGTTRIWDTRPFCQILNVADTFQKWLTFLLFNFCNNGLFVEVSNNEIFDILTSNSFFKIIFVNGGSLTNAEVYQGFLDDKKVEEHCCTTRFW